MQRLSKRCPIGTPDLYNMESLLMEESNGGEKSREIGVDLQ